MSLQSEVIQDLNSLDTAAQGRVHHELVPQGVELPFVAVTELSSTRPMALSGQGLLARSTIRLAIFSRKSSEMDSIAEAIKTRFAAFRGMLGQTRVCSVRIETASDEIAVSDGDNIIKGKGLDLNFVYY